MIAPSFIPSPAQNGFYLGPLFVHAYGLAYVFAVAAAALIKTVVRRKSENRMTAAQPALSPRPGR